jgi:hypothetical protein
VQKGEKGMAAPSESVWNMLQTADVTIRDTGIIE